MKLRVYLLAALTLLGCPLSVHAQESSSSSSTIAGSPWVQNRAIGEGIGVRTGNVEWHPGISGEFGYDSNWFQRANSEVEETNFGPVLPSLRFRVIPQISLRTVDRAREEGKDVRTVPKPAVTFNLDAAALYNEFIGLKSGTGETFADQRNVGVRSGAGLKILPGRVWSGDVVAGYNFYVEPSNLAGQGGQFDRHMINGGASIKWAPGGGAFNWTLLDYGAVFTLFDQGEFGVYNNGSHKLSTKGMWRFLPKTAILYDGSFDIIRYEEEGQNDGELLGVRMGLNGLLTKRIALLAMAGWGASFYQNDNGVVRNFNGLLAKAEAKWFLSSDGKLKDGDADVGASAVALGYIKDYANSYLGDYYSRNRGYAQMSYLIGGQVVTTAAVGASLIQYPDFYVEGEAAQPGFDEARIDAEVFAEYRPLQTVGVNLQLRYDQNISRVLTFPTYQDDLSFSRFRAMLGVRWFL